MFEIGLDRWIGPIAGVIDAQCRRVAIQKHPKRHAADVPGASNLAPKAIQLGPCTDGVR